tara:strand:+ start:719 stop:1099 length:381 start_codon:yes stop_codon:yes gene_type:complete
MKDSFRIFIVYAILILFVLFFSITCNSQTTVNDKTFNTTQTGISIVEFCAEWNEANQCNWIKDIVNAKSYRIDLESQTAKDYKIKVLPTLIVFNDGEEIKRFEGNISFKICPKRTPKKIQKLVNNL